MDIWRRENLWSDGHFFTPSFKVYDDYHSKESADSEDQIIKYEYTCQFLTPTITFCEIVPIWQYVKHPKHPKDYRLYRTTALHFICFYVCLKMNWTVKKWKRASVLSHHVRVHSPCVYLPELSLHHGAWVSLTFFLHFLYKTRWEESLEGSRPDVRAHVARRVCIRNGSLIAAGLLACLLGKVCWSFNWRRTVPMGNPGVK